MNHHKVIIRPSHTKLPCIKLPLYLRSVGHYRFEHGQGERCDTNQKYVQVFWGVDGHGELTLGKEKFRFGANDVAFKFTKDAHSYCADSGAWELRWVVFDGRGAEAFLRSYSYPKLIRNAGKCPHDLFMEFETGLREMTLYRQRKLVSVLAEVLALAGGADETLTRQGRMVRRFIDWAQENYSKSLISINQFAEQIGVHRSTLSRTFKGRMNLSPLEYLVQIRMQRALDMLRNTDLPVADIGVSVGIPDPTYFSRCVKKTTGYGPREFRAAEIPGY